MKPINVVAAIIKKNNKYLITKRNRRKHLGLKWEFPGGKVERKETLKDALVREIQEELTITINVNMKIGEENFKDEKINIIIHYYLCSIKEGFLKLNEHEEFLWVEKKNIQQYDFVPGDKKIFPVL